MEKEIRKTCCFTGHRPEQLPFKFDEQHPDCVRLRELLRKEIERLVTEEGVSHFITGMTLGIDQMCAELVLELKESQPQVTLECAIPYEEQAANWTVPQRERYFDIIVRSDKENQIQGVYSKDCMSRRNRYMVERSGHVLAVWDGAARSGTGQTIRYAREMDRNITIIHPVTMEITREKKTEPAQK